jgi:hypothetical protein
VSNVEILGKQPAELDHAQQEQQQQGGEKGELDQ